MVANILSFSEITKTLTFLPSNGDDAQFRLVKLCLASLAAQPNVQALWHSLLEKIIIVLIYPRIIAAP